MTNVNVIGWNSAAKTIKARIGSEEVIFKASTSLMARLLVITERERKNVLFNDALLSTVIWRQTHG